MDLTYGILGLGKGEEADLLGKTLQSIAREWR
jgi:hypothetical protein